MTAPRIVVVGSSNTDLIVKTSRIPRPGETIGGGAFSTAAGGKGANQAVAASRMGGQVTLVARIGVDEFGDRTLQGLRSEGIDTRYVSRDPEAASGIALIIVDEQGENSIAVAPGANHRLHQQAIIGAAAAFENAQVLLLQLETPLDSVLFAVELARQNGLKVILNPAPAPVQAVPDELLRQIDILTPNEWEAKALTGIEVKELNDAEQAALMLMKKGIGSVIITLGPRGVWLADREKSEWIPGFSVKAVDTTAAGDVFNGALAVALAEQRPLQEAVRIANAAAAISVTRLGAQPSAPRREEVLEYLTKTA